MADKREIYRKYVFAYTNAMLGSAAVTKADDPVEIYAAQALGVFDGKRTAEPRTMEELMESIQQITKGSN